MNILQNTTIISVLLISTFIHGITKSNLFRYPIETVDSKYGTKEKSGVKFEKKKKKRNDYINKRFPGCPFLSTGNLPSNVLLYQLDEKENSEFAFFVIATSASSC